MTKSKSTTFLASEPTTWSALLTVDQTAQILNISPWTLRQWDNQKKLVALRIGNRQDRRYKKEDILKIVSNGLK